MAIKIKIMGMSVGERLLIWRRRANMSQRLAAEHYRLSLYQYRCWENHDEAGGRKVPALGKLKPHEVFLLARRRSGWSATDLAVSMGISRWWLCQMEAGKVSTNRLAHYWK